MGDAADPFKGSVSIRDLVKFMWTIAWPGGNHTAVHRLRLDNALCNDRRIPLPPGWEVAVNALKLADHARDISQSSLPLDVRRLDCKLLGLPKRFDLPQNDLSPGACVALVVDGGAGLLEPTTVVNLTGELPEVLRQGAGAFSAF